MRYGIAFGAVVATTALAWAGSAGDVTGRVLGPGKKPVRVRALPVPWA